MFLYSTIVDVSITDLRANLAHYLAKAKAGERVVITERGKPIAALGPATEDAWIADLEARGIISPPLNPGQRKPMGMPEPLGPEDLSLSDIVIEQRGG